MGGKTNRMAMLGAAAAMAMVAEVGHAQSTGAEGFGDFVWDDLNQNGIQDLAEPGIPGVVVNLFRNDDSYVTSIASDTTDASGNYFLTVGSGGANFRYIVQFTLPAGFQFSPFDQGGDDALDSDVIDFATGRTDVIFGFNFPPPPDSGPILTVDAGIHAVPTSVAEPGTLALLGLGLLGLMRRAWRHR